MAPHPMYSIGYIGYYGMCILSQSYVILFVSLAAHALQFTFLYLVENPHIDRIYNSGLREDEGARRHRELLYRGPSAYFRRDLIALKNFDAFRATDVLTLLVVVYAVVGYLMGMPLWYHVAHCIAWRLFHTFGIGTLLHLQSTRQLWTAHFIKYGFRAQDAFQSWKGIYNLSMTMTHVSFSLCALSLYTFPDAASWTSGTALLKHTIGAVLIALHLWSSVEVLQVIKEFGWFYGDFFISGPDAPPPPPTYTGIYRFVNNPEKIIGHAAFYGQAIMTSSWTMVILAAMAQLCTFAVIRYVEKPHMRRLYGENVRSKSGVETAIMTKIKPLKIVKEVEKLTGSAKSLLAEVKAPQVQEKLSAVGGG